MSRRMRRRDFLRLSALATAGTALAACAPEVVKETVIVEKPVDKVVKETVIVEGTPQVVEKVVTAVPSQQEPITLVYPNKWHSRAEAKYEATDWIISTFEAKYPYIKIDSIPNPNKPEMLKKIQADCVAGDCPDLFERARQEEWNSGWLLDLVPYIDDVWMSRLEPESVKMNSWEGHIFGIGTEISPVPCWWNLKVLEQVDAEPPTNWEEILTLAEALKQEGLFFASFAFGLDNHLPWNLLRRQPGADEAQVNEQWDSEYVRFTVERLKELSDGGYHPPNDLDMSWRQAVPLWQNHRMALLMNGAWGIAQMIDAEGLDPELKEKVVFTPMPKTGPEGNSTGMVCAGQIGIGKHLENDPNKLDAALKFVDHFTSVDAALKWADSGRSLMGVRIPPEKWQTILERRPLLAAFMTAWDSSDVQWSVSLPSLTIRTAAWVQFVPIRDSLLSGGSVDDAVAAYAAEMEKFG